MDLLDLEFVICRSRAIPPGPDAWATVGFVRRESAFDQDLAALLQVLFADLRQPAPGGAAEPGRDLDDLALLVGIRSLVATLKIVTGVPEGVKRISGSPPR